MTYHLFLPNRLLVTSDEITDNSILKKYRMIFGLHVKFNQYTQKLVFVKNHWRDTDSAYMIIENINETDMIVLTLQGNKFIELSYDSTKSTTYETSSEPKLKYFTNIPEDIVRRAAAHRRQFIPNR